MHRLLKLLFVLNTFNFFLQALTVYKQLMHTSPLNATTEEHSKFQISPLHIERDEELAEMYSDDDERLAIIAKKVADEKTSKSDDRKM